MQSNGDLHFWLYIPPHVPFIGVPSGQSGLGGLGSVSKQIWVREVHLGQEIPYME